MTAGYNLSLLRHTSRTRPYKRGYPLTVVYHVLQLVGFQKVCTTEASESSRLSQGLAMVVEHMGVEFCSVTAVSAGQSHVQVLETAVREGMSGGTSIDRSGVLEVAELGPNSVFHQLLNANPIAPITYPGSCSRLPEEWLILHDVYGISGFVLAPMRRCGATTGAVMLGVSVDVFDMQELQQLAQVVAAMLELCGLHLSVHEMLSLLHRIQAPQQSINDLLCTVLEELPALLQSCVSGGPVWCQLAVMQDHKTVVFFNLKEDAQDCDSACPPALTSPRSGTSTARSAAGSGSGSGAVADGATTAAEAAASGSSGVTTALMPSLRQLSQPAEGEPAGGAVAKGVCVQLQQQFMQSRQQRLPQLPTRDLGRRAGLRAQGREGGECGPALEVHTGRLRGSVLAEVLQSRSAWVVSNSRAIISSFPSAATELLHLRRRPSHAVLIPLLNKQGKKYGALYLFCLQGMTICQQSPLQQVVHVVGQHLHTALLGMNLRRWLKSVDVLKQGMPVLAGAVATTLQAEPRYDSGSSAVTDSGGGHGSNSRSGPQQPQREQSGGSSAFQDPGLEWAGAAGTEAAESGSGLRRSITSSSIDCMDRVHSHRRRCSPSGRRLSRSRSLFQVYSDVLRERIEEHGPLPWCRLEDIRLESLVGQGAFGRVYKGHVCDRTVAVKVMKYRPDTDPKFLGRTAVEVATMTNLDHPNIVKVHSHFEDVECVEERNPATGLVTCSFHSSGQLPALRASRKLACIIVMQFCNLGNLMDAIRTGLYITRTPGDFYKTTINLKLILVSLTEIVQAIQYLHDLGIIHCDLKPHNILLTSVNTSNRFKCQLTDFGLAQILLDDACVHGDSTGTPTHLAPEIFEVGAKKGTKSATADIYAIGIIMWEMYHGLPAYHDMLEQEDMVKQIVLHRHRPTWASNAMPQYRQLAERCYAHEPGERPAPGEVLKELAAIQSRL